MLKYFDLVNMLNAFGQRLFAILLFVFEAGLDKLGWLDIFIMVTILANLGFYLVEVPMANRHSVILNSLALHLL